MVLMVPVPAALASCAKAKPAETKIVNAAIATPPLLRRRPPRAATSLRMSVSFRGAFNEWPSLRLEAFLQAATDVG
jgi:hypothetical protein